MSTGVSELQSAASVSDAGQDASENEAPRGPRPSMQPAYQGQRGYIAPPGTGPRKLRAVNKFKVPPMGHEDLKSPLLLKKLIAEFLGTALLVFFGIGSVITAAGGCAPVSCFKDSEDWNRGSCPPDNTEYWEFCKVGGMLSTTSALHISFAFGIAVASIAQAIGHISGAHLNPAVSFGLIAAGECSVLRGLVYSGVQIFGAVFGAGLLKICTWTYLSYNTFPSDPKKYDPHWSSTYGWSLGVSVIPAGTHIWQAIIIEILLTFILVLTVCGCIDSVRKDVKGSAPLAIGFAVFLCHAVGIQLTGCSVNPARSIGPALYVSKKAVPLIYNHLFVYIIGPLLGGILAGAMYNVFFRAHPDDEPTPQTPAEIRKIS